MKNRLAVLCALIAFAPVSSTAEEVSAARRAGIIQLMELTGSKEIGQQIGAGLIQQMVGSLARSRPDLPDNTFQVVGDAVNGVLVSHYDEIFERMVPLYAKHYTSEDIHALIAFYETPIGKKSIQKMPALTQEAMQIGAEWAQSLTPQLEDAVRTALEREGITQVAPAKQPPAEPERP